MKNSKQRKTIIYSTVFASITLATIVGAAVEAIVGFIAVYFFAPFWNYIMNQSKSKANVDKQDQ